MAALADLTHALIGLGRLVDLSGQAHARAEADAARTRTNAYTGGGLDADAFLRVSPGLPPSSLGGSVASGLGDVHAWILDQVEGFVWPGADIERLRDAAGCWRRTGGSVADLTGHLYAVTRVLDRQLSPEIPLALSAIADLRSLVEDTADQLLALADACDDYAAAVEDTRARTRSLLAEIGQMIVEEVALTAIVAGITGGLGGGIKAGAALARIRAQAPRFHALLTALRAVVATAATRLRTAEDQLVGARDGFERFVRAPVRDERGEMVLPGGWRTDLEGQDGLGGHIASRHMGKTVDELAARSRAEGLRFASSFSTSQHAERAIEKALSSNTNAVQTWLSGRRPKVQLDASPSDVVGTSVDAAGRVLEVSSVRVVLVPADTPFRLPSLDRISATARSKRCWTSSTPLSGSSSARTCTKTGARSTSRPTPRCETSCRGTRTSGSSCRTSCSKSSRRRRMMSWMS